jgi:hypothetical protein
METQTIDAGQQTITVAAPTVNADATQSVTPAQTPETVAQAGSTTTTSQDDLDIIAQLVMAQTPPANTSVSQPDEGTVTRIQQENARLRNAIKASGYDPDTMDTLTNQPIVPPYQQQRTTDPKSQLEALRNKVRKQGNATMDDFFASMDIQQSILESQDRKDTMSAESQNIQRCISAIESVAQSDPVFVKLPQTIQSIEHDLMIAGTDYALLQDARTRNVPDPRQMMNPQNYQQYAKKQQESMKAYRQFWFNAGKKQASGNPAPNVQPNVQPLTNSSGFTPAMPRPASSFNKDDIAASIRNYQAGIKRL